MRSKSFAVRTGAKLEIRLITREVEAALAEIGAEVELDGPRTREVQVWVP